MTEGRFHRSRYRKRLMVSQHVGAPPSEEELKQRLAQSSQRRRHSLYEYENLTTHRYMQGMASQSVTSSPRDKDDLAWRRGIDTMQVRWVEGPLGVTFHRQGNDTVVKHTTNILLAQNDKLVAINNESIEDLDYLDVMIALKSVQKPATLTFCRDNDTNEESKLSAPDNSTRSERAQKDEMYQVLANLLKDHDESQADEFDAENTHLSQITCTSTLLAYCQCVKCSSPSASCDLTESTLDSHNIDAFDQDIIEFTCIQRSTHTLKKSASPKMKDAATSPLQTSTNEIGTMTIEHGEPPMVLEKTLEAVPVLPSAPILVVAQPVDNLTVNFASNEGNINDTNQVPLAVPVTQVPEPTKGSQPAGDTTEQQPSLTTSTPPPTLGLGHFINHMFNSLTIPKSQPHSIPESKTRATTSTPPQPRESKRSKKIKYQVEWSTPTLGLVLQNQWNGVFIGTVNENAISSEFQVGDKLVAIQEMDVRSMSYHQTIQLLQSITKPMKLTFQRKVEK